MYAIPFLLSVGGAVNEFRNHCRDMVINPERQTGISIYGQDCTAPILDRAYDIEHLTSQVHLCGANVAESQKYLSVHIRVVEEFIWGLHMFQVLYSDGKNSEFKLRPSA